MWDADTIVKAIRQFPRGTAPGGSGLRAQHLLDALEIPLGDSQNRISGLMATICRTLVCGRGPPALSPWLAGASLFPLRKKDGGVRPIAVGEIFRRLVARLSCASSVIKERAASLFMQAKQLGVGLKGGAEMAVQALRTWLDRQAASPKLVLKLDFSNAYNTVSRAAVWRQLRVHFPELCPWFQFCYAQPANLFCQGDLLDFSSATGVQQGDPLAPLYFSLAVLPCIRALQTEVPACLTLWYLDDGVVAGPPQDVARAWEIVSREAAAVNLSLNPPKCEVWGSAPLDQFKQRFPSGVQFLTTDGFEFLGSPVGSAAFANATLMKRVARIRALLDRLHVVADPQVEFVLLRSCCGLPRFAFSLRATPPGEIAEAVAQFDALLAAKVAERFAFSLDEQAEIQWHLPVRMGGCGMTAAADVAPAAFLGSAIQVVEKVAALLGEALSIADIPGVSQTLQEINARLAQPLLPLPAHTLAFLQEGGLALPAPPTFPDLDHLVGVMPPTEKPQHFFASRLHLLRLMAWLAKERPSLSPLQRRREATRKLAVLRGDRVTGYAGSWLNAVPNRATGMKLSPLEFATLLRWWLGLRMFHGQCIERSAAGRKCDSALDPFGDHAVSCPVGPGRIARHDAVNVTWMLAERAAGMHVQREVRVDPESNRRTADTFVWDWDRGQPCAQDWVVTHLLAPSHLNVGFTDPNAAVVEAEDRKMRQASLLCASRGVDFLPLAIDSFGGFGPAATKAVARVANQARIMEEVQQVAVSSKRLGQRLRFVALRSLTHQLIRRLPSQSESGFLVDTHNCCTVEPLQHRQAPVSGPALLLGAFFRARSEGAAEDSQYSKDDGSRKSLGIEEGLAIPF